MAISFDASKALSQLRKIASQLDNAVSAGLNEAAHFGATMAKTNTYYKPRTGKLQSMTTAVDESTFIKHVRANTFYASYVNFGNGPPGSRIYPKKAKALRFVMNGQIMFRKSVKTSVPRPFMTAAFQSLKVNAPRIVAAKLTNLFSRI